MKIYSSNNNKFLYKMINLKNLYKNNRKLSKMERIRMIIQFKVYQIHKAYPILKTYQIIRILNLIIK
jgi:hypothetical protein